MVVKRNVNDGSVMDMAERFRGTGIILRFIEFMDVGTTNGWRLDDVVPAQELVDQLSARWPLEPVAPRYPGEVANRLRYLDGAGEIGVIASVTRPFCGDCTRARLSAEGELYTCLFAAHGRDLRGAAARGRDRRAAGRAAGPDLGQPRRPLLGAAQRRDPRPPARRDVPHRRLTHPPGRRRDPQHRVPSPDGDVGLCTDQGTCAGCAVLPKGWPDFVLQLVLFAVADLLYEISRTLAKGDLAVAFVHARDVVSIEKSMGIFTELDVQHWALARPWVLDVANTTYFHAHFAVTTCFMFWLYLRRNHHYYFVRNIIFSAMALALIGYILFPTAPPRMLTDLGFIDTLEKTADVNFNTGAVLAALEPVRGRAQRAHLLLADHRHQLLLPGTPARHPLPLAALPLPDRVFDRGNRQPLLA